MLKIQKHKLCILLFLYIKSFISIWIEYESFLIRFLKVRFILTFLFFLFFDLFYIYKYHNLITSYIKINFCRIFFDDITRLYKRYLYYVQIDNPQIDTYHYFLLILNI
jgi:hypothetical protein